MCCTPLCCSYVSTSACSRRRQQRLHSPAAASLHRPAFGDRPHQLKLRGGRRRHGQAPASGVRPQRQRWRRRKSTQGRRRRGWRERQRRRRNRRRGWRRRRRGIPCQKGAQTWARDAAAVVIRRGGGGSGGGGAAAAAGGERRRRRCQRAARDAIRQQGQSQRRQPPHRQAVGGDGFWARLPKAPPGSAVVGLYHPQQAT